MFGPTVQEWLNTPQANLIAVLMGVAWFVAYISTFRPTKNRTQKPTRSTDLVRKED